MCKSQRNSNKVGFFGRAKSVEAGGGGGISGDTAEGRGMMREDEQSPGAAGSSGRCLVLSRTQFLGLRGKSPPDDQLYSAVLGSSNTLAAPLLSHSVFLGQQTKNYCHRNMMSVISWI